VSDWTSLLIGSATQRTLAVLLPVETKEVKFPALPIHEIALWRLLVPVSFYLLAPIIRISPCYEKVKEKVLTKRK